MRILWISRSNKPDIVSSSQFFVSLATGIIFISHCKYLSPLIVTQSYPNFQNSMGTHVANECSCLFFLWVLHYCREKGKEGKDKQKQGGQKGKKEQGKERKLTLPNLIYPGLIKTALYLSMIILISEGQGLDVSIASISTLAFICWLFLCSNDNPMAKTVLKGRTFSANPLKISLLFLLILIAIAIQPQQYIFSFPLHFQIFIVFITAFLIFSYFFLHKLAASFSTRQSTPKILCQECLCELFSLLLIWLYYILTSQQGLSFIEQFQYLRQKWYGLVIIAVLTPLYEMVLWEHVKKVALSQLAVTLATGFLWFNIYLMTQTGIDMRLYISVVVMITVLLTNIGLLSEDNRKRICKLWAFKKKKKKRQQLEQQQERGEEE